jgi:hypothetical protein
MNLRDINKRYIDDVLDYYIKEMYSWKYFEYKSASERDIEVMLNKRLEVLHKGDFVIDWKVNVNLRTKQQRRAAKLEGLLDGVEDEGSFIEVLYQIPDRSMYSVRISEEELLKYKEDKSNAYNLQRR